MGSKKGLQWSIISPPAFYDKWPDRHYTIESKQLNEQHACQNINLKLQNKFY